MRQTLCAVRIVAGRFTPLDFYYLLSNGVKIISFITDQQVIRQILKHLGFWTQTPSRDPPPPNTEFSLKTMSRFIVLHRKNFFF